jgi:predicted Rossmann-fold nucleotide-binding protein
MMSAQLGAQPVRVVVGSDRGRSSRLLEEEAEQVAHVLQAHGVVGRGKWHTPELGGVVEAPPSSSKLTSSPVTVFTTSGPVMNMYEVSSTMNTKSVMAGE